MHPNSPVKISWAEFQEEYLTREDGYKYEWLDGIVEQTPRPMDKSQFFVQKNLINFLFQIKAQKFVPGNLIAEGDTFFGANHRRPDLAYYTDTQIEAARHHENVVPEFVVEVISTNDHIIKVTEKLRNYRAAEVKVIWLVFPDSQEVHVYHGKKSVVCTGDDVCSAEPVIAGFALPAKDVFK